MTKQQALGYSLVVAILFAVAVGQILTSLNVIQNLVFYSVLGTYENAFLAAYTVGFSLCLLFTQHARFSQLRITPAGVICFLIAFQCSLSLGLASLALLWLIPWWLYQFGGEPSPPSELATEKVSH